MLEFYHYSMPTVPRQASLPSRTHGSLERTLMTHPTRRDLLAAMSSCAAVTLLPTLTLPESSVAGTPPEAPHEAAEPDFLVIPTRVYPTPEAPDGLFPVKYRRLLPPTAPRARYPGFRPGRWTLKAGTVRRRGALPLPVDIVFERDVAMKLRDGTTIYTDVFRPVGETPVPAIFGWSPYGKAVGGQWLDDLPGRSGVPLARVSELQRFEGADPAYWCAHGYAVVNPDPRGALMSEGNVNYWGRQLAEDGHDFIEWVAAQPWCSGKVVMSGNSWLAVSQWFIAAERPPHLVAIAPWEGLMDQGPASVPAAVVFGETIIQSLAGNGYVEDQPRMLLENPVMNAFWQDRRASNASTYRPTSSPAIPTWPTRSEPSTPGVIWAADRSGCASTTPRSGPTTTPRRTSRTCAASSIITPKARTTAGPRLPWCEWRSWTRAAATS